MEVKPVKLIQISDIHLFQDSEQTLLGVNTQKSLEALVQMIKKNTNSVNMAILSGDLAQDHAKTTYRRLAEILATLDVPIYCLPGNHDDPDLMSKIYPLKNISAQHQVVLDQWQIILLNSHKEKSVEGYLAPDQLQLLKSALEAYPEHHAMVVLHHPPLSVGSAWLDPLQLTNAAEFWQLLKTYPQVRTVLFGHVHQVHEGKKNGITYYSAPSTCIQFKPNQETFKLDSLPQGYRWVELYPTGELKTGVIRLPSYVGQFLENATGY